MGAPAAIVKKSPALSATTSQSEAYSTLLNASTSEAPKDVNADIAAATARTDVDTVNIGGELRGTAGGLQRAKNQQNTVKRGMGSGSTGAQLLGS